MPHAPKNRIRLAVTALEARDVPAVVAAYAVTQSWGSGFQAEVRLANDGAAAVPFSDLKFTLPASVQSVWDARVVSHAGTKYGVTNAGWNAAVPAHGAVTFGLTAAGPNVTATEFVLNGVPLGTTVPPSVPPTVPPTTPPAPPPVAGSSLSFQVTGDWGTGMSGEVRVTNTGTVALSNWRVGFDLPANLGSVWNGAVVSHVGTRYAVAPESWNATIQPGATAAIGFTATPGGVTATNLVLTVGGAVVPPPAPPANRAPVAVADSATTAAGAPVTVAVLANDTDPDGDALAVTAAGPAAHGTVTVGADGAVRYAPAQGFTGADSFAYTVSDGRGGTATAAVGVTVTAAPPAGDPAAWPGRVFAPYVDATLWPTYDVVAAARSTGVKQFTLGFVTADAQARPAWGGYASYAITGTEFDLGMRTRVSDLRAVGGDVAVSFGGASGQELAQVITSVPALTAAYRSVIQAYNLTRVDFDVEGGALADTAANARRAQAVATLQQEATAAGRTLSVRFTLPALPTGLTPAGVALLTNAKQLGARVDVVNVMAMDYGDGAAPNPAGHMGDYAIQAATSLFTQLTALHGATTTDAQRWKMVGVTPMIGLNDVTTEVFDQQEARELAAWAAQRDIGLLSMWSLNRDRQNAGGAIGYVDTSSSSVTQTPFEFSGIFRPFTA